MLQRKFSLLLLIGFFLSVQCFLVLVWFVFLKGKTCAIPVTSLPEQISCMDCKCHSTSRTNTSNIPGVESEAFFVVLIVEVRDVESLTFWLSRDKQQTLNNSRPVRASQNDSDESLEIRRFLWTHNPIIATLSPLETFFVNLTEEHQSSEQQQTFSHNLAVLEADRQFHGSRWFFDCDDRTLLDLDALVKLLLSIETEFPSSPLPYISGYPLTIFPEIEQKTLNFTSLDARAGIIVNHVLFNQLAYSIRNSMRISAPEANESVLARYAVEILGLETAIAQGVYPFSPEDMVRIKHRGKLPTGVSFDPAEQAISHGGIDARRMTVMLNPNRFIPQIIHQIWIGNASKIPHRWVNSCKSLHKDWTYILWNETLLNQAGLSSNPIGTRFANHKAVLFRVDAVRLELLYRYGGMYLDIDTYCLKNLNPFINQHTRIHRTEMFAGWETKDKKLLATGVIGAVQYSRSILTMLHDLHYRPLSALSYNLTGAGLITDSFRAGRISLTDHPHTVFYPYHSISKFDEIGPDSIERIKDSFTFHLFPIKKAVSSPSIWSPFRKRVS